MTLADHVQRAARQHPECGEWAVVEPNPGVVRLTPYHIETPARPLLSLLRHVGYSVFIHEDDQSEQIIVLGRDRERWISPEARIAHVRASIGELYQAGADRDAILAAERHLAELLEAYRRGELRPIPDDGLPF